MKISRILLIVIFISCIIPSALQSQVIVTDPAYPVENDVCVVTFDATRGTAGLKDAGPPVYAHTGVITNLSSSGTDWRYVIADWNVNLPKALMTPLGNNKYSITLQPSIREFYGVPATETIEKIAFVFRNADGSKTGKDTGGADIFADVYSSSFGLNIISPANKDLFKMHNTVIPVEAASPEADSLLLYMNGTLKTRVAGTSLKDTIVVTSLQPDWVRQVVKIVAKNDTGSVADSFYYTAIPQAARLPLPPGMVDGINYIDSASAVIVLYAPYNTHCFAIGDFNDWKPDSAHYMNFSPDDGTFWITINGLEPGKEYLFQYLVDGTLKLADPYADKISDPDDQYISQGTYPGLIPYPAGKTTGIASSLQTDQPPYQWDTATFVVPENKDLVIFELLIRDFTQQHDYPSLIDTLGYLKRLGINAIELMPVMEFEGNISWGYNPDFMFAPDKYYGTKNGLKQFIEAAHKNGIAVILDIVLNHQFGNSPLVKLYWDASNGRPAPNNPWFDPIPRHPYNVGYDFNHESHQTRVFCKRVLKYWISEYHADGYRLDLSKGFTQKDSYPDNVAAWGQYDQSRINILEDYRDAIRSVKPDALIILEHFADNDEEIVLSDAGMMLWGNMNYNYNEATMGWTGNSDFSKVSYEARGWSQPNLVGYMESHDEERLAYKNVRYGNTSNPDYNVQDTVVSFDRLQEAAAFFFTVPGPKMIWQFGELGYDYSINYPSGTSESRLSPKPIRWDYYSQWQRKYLYNIFSALINLKKNLEVFKTNDFTMNTVGSMKKILLNGTTMKAAVIGNFDVVDGTIDPGFQQSGTWYDYFSGDSINVVNVNDPMHLRPGEYHIYTTERLARPLFTGMEEENPGNGAGSRQVRVYPNPSEGRFNFVIDMNGNSRAALTVYDVTGRLINSLSFGSQPSGSTIMTWDGTDHSGRKVPAGIYFSRIETGNFSTMQKLIVE